MKYPPQWWVFFVFAGDMMDSVYHDERGGAT
jgi:hypothetical protein